MKRTALLGLLLLQTAVANAAGETLSLSDAELGRLGVVFAAPEAAAWVEVAAGPAEVVIPPTRQVVVGPSVSGILSRLLVAEGDTVEAGQAIAEVESNELLALQRDYINAFAGNELAAVQLQRDRDLRADGIIAERRLQETSAAATAASVALDQSRQQLQLAGMSKKELESLARGRQLSSTLTLRSPLSGIVVRQLSPLGSQVDAMGPVFRVADIATLWLEVRVPQQQAAAIAPGMHVIAPDFDERLYAEIFHVGPVVDEASQTVLIRAATDNAQLSLRPGQFLSARIVAGAAGEDRTYVVPSRAVVRDGESSLVFVRTGDGVVARKVRLLSDNGEQSSIVADESIDAAVATTGLAALKSIWLERGVDEG